VKLVPVPSDAGNPNGAVGSFVLNGTFKTNCFFTQ
jgi:hypothetical protein